MKLFASCAVSLRTVCSICLGLSFFILVGCGKQDEVSSPTSPPAKSSTKKEEKAGPNATAPKATAKKEPQAKAKPKKKAKNKLAVAPEFVLENPTVPLTAEEISQGWISLFDGQTLFGWQSNNDMNWSVKEGSIQADAEGISLLTTTSPFTDYELLCEFKAEAGGNSGLFLRTSADPQDPTTECYELNICDTHEKFKTGSLVGRTQPLEEVSGEGDWKVLKVVVNGNHISALLGETKILDFEDESEHQLASGRIGLQKNKGKIEFRKVLIKPINTQPLFDGESLTGWREVPGSDSSFEVSEGTIAVKGGQESGRGFLETESTWDDFTLQLEVKSNGEALNSGIFFRALPGTKEAPSHGYEMQIQNGFKNEDRRQPTDHGSGAIFRRTFARWVNANDHEWFTMTLVTFGPHISTWINGLQVTDWTDTREKHENPRKGLRLEAGHISIQGHDPTTDLNFRNLRIQPVGK